jgi:iron-sulfur cluster assembly protein
MDQKYITLFDRYTHGAMSRRDFLRVGVKGGGCSGFSYVMNLEPSPARGDEIFESEGLKLFVDPKSYLYLEGTMVDFNDDLTQRGFVFKNPGSSGTCGCGASFSV